MRGIVESVMGGCPLRGHSSRDYHDEDFEDAKQIRRVG